MKKGRIVNVIVEVAKNISTVMKVKIAKTQISIF